MFAILFTDKMDGFYAIIASFPTVIFTVLLAVSVIYWLITFFGLIDIDLLDIDGGDPAEVGNVNGVAGVLMKLGLNDIPLPIVVTLISLVGWIISYYSVYFLSQFIPEGLLFILGIFILIGALYLSALITSFLIRPLRKFFKRTNRVIEKNIIGSVAIVRTGRVDQGFGEASLDDGGAGLILKVRSYHNEEFKRGERVVLLEYVKESDIYRVVSEEEFKG